MEEFPRKFGPYILLKPLARGGMGALYLALAGDRGMEKFCVIKTALHHLADKSYVQRFRDEAKVVVRLSHGNLVTVFDAGQVAGELYLAMDFIEGRDLRAVWNRCAQKGQAFPIDVAVHITKELCRGLGYAHAFDGLQLVHRDVSPPNVLLSYAGEIKLTDFGLASSTLKLEKTAPGVIYGKVSYMAPEQARGETLDGRVDLYAAGIILWELLTGRQLFPAVPEAGAHGEDALLERVRHPAIVAPSKKTSRVPADLDRIVLKALAPDPGSRYQTGEELRMDLAAFQAKTSPATDGEHVARFLRELFAEHIVRERAERQQLAESASRIFGATKKGAKAEPSEAAATPVLPVAAVRSRDAALVARKPGERVGPKAGEARADSTADKSKSASKHSSSGTRAFDAGMTPAPLTDPAQDFSASEAPSKIVGGVLAGRYRVVRLCGEGGMGRVYEAEHIEIGKRVAVKVLHPAYTRTPDVVERFRREARAASRIGHPNIVNVTDSGTTDDGSFFFVMEFIEGIELGLAIHRAGPMPAVRALRITEQMCRALQAAHDAGVIHRDLKPENVLLISNMGDQDFVKVLDFGIAKSAEVEEQTKAGRRLTRPGVAMGTPEYMAPEQAAGRAADPRSDIYAVGSIMYEMLTGDPPYEGENVMEVLHKKATQAPRSLAELRPDLPPAVCELVERAMARAPAQRPQSMAALAEEIRGLLATLDGVGLLKTPSQPMPVALDQVRPVATSEPFSSLGPLGLPRRVLATAGASLVLLLGFVVVRAATSRPRAVLVSEVPSTLDHPMAAAARPAALPPARPTPPPATPPPTPAAAEPEEPDAPPTVTEEPPAAARALKRAGRKLPTPPATPALNAAEGKRLLAEAQRLVKAQRFPEARASFSRLLDAKREKGSAMVGLGQVAFQEKDYDEAIRRAKQGSSAGGGVEARLLLGDAYFKQQKYEDAAKAYQDALRLEPDNVTAKRSLDLVKRRSN